MEKGDCPGMVLEWEEQKEDQRSYEMAFWGSFCFVEALYHKYYT